MGGPSQALRPEAAPTSRCSAFKARLNISEPKDQQETLVLNFHKQKNLQANSSGNLKKSPLNFKKSRTSVLLDASAAHSYTNNRETNVGASLFTTSETGLPHSATAFSEKRPSHARAETCTPGGNTTAPGLSLEESSLRRTENPGEERQFTAATRRSHLL